MVLAAVLFSVLLQADPLSLTGIVLDSNAKPVTSAHVHLEEPTARQQWGMDTKPDGTFRFDRLPFGTYRITIRSEGYFETSAEVRLESSKTFEFTLAADEKVKQEVEVIARRDPINIDSVVPQIFVNYDFIQNLHFTG